MISHIKEKFVSYLGSISGLTSILGSWQVCHNVCLAIIAVLAVIGITITGMPLLFLTKIVVPLWIIAFLLLLVTIWIYTKKKCIKKWMITTNSGFVVAGFPFQIFENSSILFWTIGGVFVFAGLLLFFRDKRKYK